MKQFLSRVKSLSQKAAEIKAAIQQVPPKVAEIREAMTATTGQLQQLKSEIQYSVADLKADQETHLSEALQELNGSADVFVKAGFVLSAVDLEISPVQRLLVHLAKVEDVHTSVLRSLLAANQHRRTTRAILSSLLQAKQMAETVELTDLVYDEIIVGIGPIPSVRLCWRPEAVEQSAVVPATAMASTTPAPLVPQNQPASIFGAGSFFEHRESKPAAIMVEPLQTTSQLAPLASAAAVVQPKPEAPAAAPVDPLARFKKMPTLGR